MKEALADLDTWNAEMEDTENLDAYANYIGMNTLV